MKELTKAISELRGLDGGHRLEFTPELRRALDLWNGLSRLAVDHGMGEITALLTDGPEFSAFAVPLLAQLFDPWYPVGTLKGPDKIKTLRAEVDRLVVALRAHQADLAANSQMFRSLAATGPART